LDLIGGVGETLIKDEFVKGKRTDIVD